MRHRLFRVAVVAAVLVGVSVGPTPTRASVGTTYVGAASHTSGGSCADPDFSTHGSSIGAALDAAIADVDSDGDTIVICSGHYTYTSEPVGVAGMTFGFTVRASESGTVTLDGDGQYTILKASGSSMTVDGLRFVHAGSGGALVHPEGDLVVTHSVFEGNVRGANDGFGGAPEYFGGGAIAGDLICNNLVAISDSRFVNNAGPTGAVSTCSVSVTRSIFSGNSTQGQGGGLYVCSLQLSDSSFTANRARGTGGAVSACDVTQLERNKFVRNVSASDGGAIALRTYHPGDDLWQGNAFIGNRARGFGGAVAACAGLSGRSIGAIQSRNRLSGNLGRRGPLALALFCGPGAG